MARKLNKREKRMLLLGVAAAVVDLRLHLRDEGI